MPRTARRFYPFVPALGLACLLASGCSSSSTRECATLPSECSGVVPSYTSDVSPIIAARCAICHKQDDPSGAWPFETHDDISDWRSSILAELRSCSMPPPDSGKALPESERALLVNWLICGAPEN